MALSGIERAASTGIERAATGARMLLSKIDGLANIIITDKEARRIGKVRHSLIYYEGLVKYSAGGISTKAYVLPFRSCDGEGSHILYYRLNLVSSPYIVNPLAYGRGLGRYSGYTFLAVPTFTCTLSQYVDVRSNRTFYMRRFTEEFIAVIGNVVRGLVTLHSRGFYCPNLEGNHIFICNEENLITAKIWSFCFAGTAEDKSKDWIRLGHLLSETAEGHDTSTFEIVDVCNKMKNKSLMGMEVLRHSALLTVREKFDNILALNMYVLVHPIGRQVPCSDPEKRKVIADLNNFLVTNFKWVKDMPRWITKRTGYRQPRGGTGANFIDWLRNIIEHENEYVPAKVKQTMEEIQTIGRDPDLELQIRHAWGELFLEAQNFVAKLNLQY